MKTNHWGIWIDSECAITGVINNNDIEWLGDELRNGVDLEVEEHCEVCKDETHDNCGLEPGQGTVLIGGWFKDADSKWVPDEKSEYSAIVLEVYTQVVWSRYTQRTRLCSPCFPGQGDLDNVGSYLTYDIPPEVRGASKR